MIGQVAVVRVARVHLPSETSMRHNRKKVNTFGKENYIKKF
jgi:hypothetical protein